MREQENDHHAQSQAGTGSWTPGAGAGSRCHAGRLRAEPGRKGFIRRVIDSGSSEGTGMICEDGLLIYGSGTALPAGFIDNAVRRSRDERSQHLWGRHD